MHVLKSVFTRKYFAYIDIAIVRDFVNRISPASSPVSRLQSDTVCNRRAHPHTMRTNAQLNSSILVIVVISNALTFGVKANEEANIGKQIIILLMLLLFWHCALYLVPVRIITYLVSFRGYCYDS